MLMTTIDLFLKGCIIAALVVFILFTVVLTVSVLIVTLDERKEKHRR